MTKPLIDYSDVPIDYSGVGHIKAGSWTLDVPAYFDYDEELSVGRALASRCKDSPELVAALAFAYPGNGSRVYARRLCRDLCLDHKFDVVWLDARAITLSPEDVLRSGMKRLDDLLSSETLRPVVVVVHELDSIGRAERYNPPASLVQEQLGRCVRGECPPRLFLLATATSPGEAIEALPPLSATLIYLPWPNVGRIRSMIARMKIPNAPAVAERLWQRAADRQVRHTAGGIVSGAHETLNLMGGPDGLAEMGTEKIVEALSQLCSATSMDEMVNYEETHKKYIAAARASP